LTRGHGHEQSSKPNADLRHSVNRPAVRELHAPVEAATTEPPVRRPFEEPTVVNGGHQFRARTHLAQSNVLFGLVCTWVAALTAVGAALLANRRHRRSSASPTAAAQVLPMRRPVAVPRHMSRVA
jgi:hypothetical protein